MAYRLGLIVESLIGIELLGCILVPALYKGVLVVDSE
jgi:hypothetical protein